jgi:hypothetical protein
MAVAEVLRIDCLNREPRPDTDDNYWVATVRLEDSRNRVVTIRARDELAAYLKLLKEGA